MRTRSARITGKYLVKPERFVVCTRFSDWTLVIISGDEFNKDTGFYSMPKSVCFTQEEAQSYINRKNNEQRIFMERTRQSIRGGEARAA